MPRNLGFWVSLIVWSAMVSLGVHLNSAVLGVPFRVLQSATLSTSPCILLSSSSLRLPLTAIARSSAYALTVVSPSNRYRRSSRNVMKRRGESTAPWGTPSLKFLALLKVLSILTLPNLLLSQLLVHSTNASGTSFFTIFSSRAVLLTVSNARQ